MAAGAEFSPPYAILESSFNNSKDNTNSDVVSTLKNVNLDDGDNVNQLSNAKPPRQISLVRHSMSSFALCATTDVNQDGGSVCCNEAYDDNSGFQPVFRSGSSAERGPKQYMEDEHVCIDNLSGHLDASDDFPSPGAFYGVSSNLRLLKSIFLLGCVSERCNCNRFMAVVLPLSDN